MLDLYLSRIWQLEQNMSYSGREDRQKNPKWQFSIFFWRLMHLKANISKSINRVAKISTDLKSTLNSGLEKSIFGILISL